MIGETDFHVAAISVPIKQLDSTPDIEGEITCAEKSIMRLLGFRVPDDFHPCMESYALEILADCHDRAGFTSGLESVDRYLRETARGHLAKGVSVTRVLVEADSPSPKTILGFFTLSSITVNAKDWPGSPKGLPKHPLRLPAGNAHKSPDVSPGSFTGRRRGNPRRVNREIHITQPSPRLFEIV